ncbi:MAG: thermonuclease family protein [Plectolyngbya sp. WJT66-NPBG17]|jgi:endonuclease YncB( thermonuclease family)|nr:thermonuclease family protein [Plectolyngbya sp. WJT66-NPBG17]
MKPKALLNALPVVAIVVVGCLVWQRSQSSQAASSKVISAPTTHHQVARVSDGDTIVLENGDKVRFCGIDALESSQKLGSESTANLKRLIDMAEGKVIVAEHERDRYGRIVGEVFAPVPNSQEEKLLNYEQVRAGFAYEYKQYSGKCMNGFVLGDGEKLARSERRGVWKNGGNQRPWDYRRQQRGE